MVTTEKGTLPDLDYGGKTGGRGGYELDEVATYIKAADSETWGGSVSLSVNQLKAWSGRGLFKAQTASFIGRRKPYVSFQSLITVRMIAFSRSYGISLKALTHAHHWLTEILETEFPFATRPFWTPGADFRLEFGTEIVDTLETSARWGRTNLAELRDSKLRDGWRLDFQDDIASVWRPVEGVWLNPLMQTGAPCIDGTRRTTNILNIEYLSGDSLEKIASDYEMDIGLVKAAISWEKMLDPYRSNSPHKRPGLL